MVRLGLRNTSPARRSSNRLGSAAAKCFGSNASSMPASLAAPVPAFILAHSCRWAAAEAGSARRPALGSAWREWASRFEPKVSMGFHKGTIVSVATALALGATLLVAGWEADPDDPPA